MLKNLTLGAAAAALIAMTGAARAETNLLFILDSSGSMWGQLDGVAKITTAKTVLNRLMGELPADTRAGLMVYGHRKKASCKDVELIAPLGQAQRPETLKALKAIAPKGKTPIAYSLGQAKNAFKNAAADASNNVVLISDGLETCGSDPCAIAAELSSKNINVKVHVVGFDISEKDRKQLECIAEKGKGKYFSADSTDGFAEAVTAAVTVISEPPQPVPDDALFRDEFEGEALGTHWEVLNEDPDGYIVEDGKLLIVGTNAGHLKTAKVPNIIRFKGALPKGDWVATIKFTMPYQTGRETPFLAIYEDKDNHIAASTNGWSYYGGIRGARMYLSGWKRSKGKETSFGKVIWGGARGVPFTAEKAPNPILLRIAKKGRTYTPAYRLEGMKQDAWIKHEKFTALRAKGNLAIGIFQSERVKGETPMSIDWFKIEKAN